MQSQPPEFMPPPRPQDGAPPTTPDADEVRRSVSLRVDLLAVDHNTFTRTREEEMVFIEPDIVLTTLRPTDRYEHELCVNEETLVTVRTGLSLVDEVVHAKSDVVLRSGASCLSAPVTADDSYSIVAGDTGDDDLGVSTYGWNSKGGGAYEITIYLTNEPWSG